MVLEITFMGGKFPFSVIIFRRTLSSDVFERRTSTGSGPFALLSRDFEQREKSSLPFDVRRSKTSLLKLSIDSECEDCGWDSDYGNHRSAIVIVLDWYEGHRGVILE